jgi:hypothetical protein
MAISPMLKWSRRSWFPVNIVSDLALEPLARDEPGNHSSLALELSCQG